MAALLDKQFQLWYDCHMNKASPMADYKLMVDACNHKSIKDALLFLGLRPAGGNYRAFRRWCEIHGLKVPTSTGPDKIAAARLASKRKQISNEDVFVEGSKYSNRQQIKKRLIDLGTVYECALCGIGNSWNGSHLSLQLDHINSVPNDNRIENLRFLCPNCHSQTDGFAGRNLRGKKRTVQVFCVDCNISIHSKSSRCRSCAAAFREKIAWPSNVELLEMVQKFGYRAVARELGTSDSAVRKRLLYRQQDVTKSL